MAEQPLHPSQAFPLILNTPDPHGAFNSRDAQIDCQFSAPYFCRYDLTSCHHVDFRCFLIFFLQYYFARFTGRFTLNPSFVALAPHLPALIASRKNSPIVKGNPE
jgi:hypothetical protein